jgi:hypothetical protein
MENNYYINQEIEKNLISLFEILFCSNDSY